MSGYRQLSSCATATCRPSHSSPALLARLAASCQQSAARFPSPSWQSSHNYSSGHPGDAGGRSQFRARTQSPAVDTIELLIAMQQRKLLRGRICRGRPTEDIVPVKTRPLTPARNQTCWHRTAFDPGDFAKRTDFSSQGWSKGSSMTPCSTGTRISCTTVAVTAGCRNHIPALLVECLS